MPLRRSDLVLPTLPLVAALAVPACQPLDLIAPVEGTTIDVEPPESTHDPGPEPVVANVDARADLYAAINAESETGQPPTVVEVPTGESLVATFDVSGSLACCGDEEATFTADGTGTPTEVGSTRGLSGIQHPGSVFLAGVFLAEEPIEPPPPADLQAGELETLTPMLNQVFFIGDGQVGASGSPTQGFRVPAGATKLALGFVDPGGFADNLGSLTALVYWAPWQAAPCTGTITAKWPKYLTPDGPCFSYHMAHRGLKLYAEAAKNEDSITYTAKTNCPNAKVVGHVRGKKKNDLKGIKKIDLTSTKTLIGGKEKGRRKGEPTQL